MSKTTTPRSKAGQPKNDAEHIRKLQVENDILKRQLVAQNETIESKNVEIANLNQDNKRLRLDLQNALSTTITK